MTIPLTNRGNKVKQHGTKGQISRRFKKCGGHSEEGKSSEPRTPERWVQGLSFQKGVRLWNQVSDLLSNPPLFSRRHFSLSLGDCFLLYCSHLRWTREEAASDSIPHLDHWRGCGT